MVTDDQKYVEADVAGFYVRLLIQSEKSHSHFVDLDLEKLDEKRVGVFGYEQSLIL